MYISHSVAEIVFDSSFIYTCTTRTTRGWQIATLFFCRPSCVRSNKVNFWMFQFTLLCEGRRDVTREECGCRKFQFTLLIRMIESYHKNPNESMFFTKNTVQYPIFAYTRFRRRIRPIQAKSVPIHKNNTRMRKTPAESPQNVTGAFLTGPSLILSVKTPHVPVTPYKPHTAVKPLSWRRIPKQAVTGLFEAHACSQGHFR